LTEKTLNSMLKSQTYLEPIRNSLQRPIGGRSAQFLSTLFKAALNNRGIVFFEHYSTVHFYAARSCEKYPIYNRKRNRSAKVKYMSSPK